MQSAKSDLSTLLPGSLPVATHFDCPAQPTLPWHSVASHTLLLGGSLASISSALLLVAKGVSVSNFVNNNVIESGVRVALLKCLAGGLVLPCLSVLLLWYAFPRSRALLESSIVQAAQLTCPALLAWALPALLDRAVWDAKLLTMLLVLGGFVLCLERACRLSFAAIPHFCLTGSARLARMLPRRVVRFGPILCVVAAAAAYATYTGYYSVVHHHRLGTSAFDLGIYDNLMTNTLRGDFFKSPVLFGPKGGNYLANHAPLILALFVPFYAIYQHPETLLILQSVLMGSAAVTLYLFASTQIPRLSACVLSLLYLCYAPLHGANFYDFHPLTAAATFQFLLYFAIARRRIWLIVGTLLILFSIREDIPIGIGILGAALIVSGQRTREGVLVFGMALPAFVLIKFVLMPWAGTWWFADLYKGLMIAGESGYGSVIKTLATNPLFVFHSLLEEKKLIYWLHLAAPLAFLAYRRWGFAIVASSGALTTLLTTNYAPTISIAFHYTVHWIPYLFGASVVVLRGLEQNGKWWRVSALSAAGTGLLIHSFLFGAILNPVSFRGGFGTIPFRALNEQESSRYRAMRDLVAMIPATASVAASEDALPHASNRRIAYPIRMWTGNADYLLVGTRSLGLGRTRRGIREAVDEGYGLLAGRQGVYLFKRGHKSDKTAQALRELGI